MLNKPAHPPAQNEIEAPKPSKSRKVRVPFQSEIPTIAVFVRGGCVQDVCFGGGQVRVIVVDFDTDGVGSGIYVDPDTSEASYCNVADYQRNAAEVGIDGEYVRSAIKTADDPWHAFRDNEEERARVEAELSAERVP